MSRRERIETAIQLDTIARKLEVRSQLTAAPLLQERAHEWAGVLRHAESLLIDRNFPMADPSIGLEPVL